MRLFVSIFAYAFGKQHGSDNVDRAFAIEIERGERSSLPAVRTLHRMRRLLSDDDVIELHTDHSTLIARARDRAAGRFLRSHCEQWISIDEDVDADASAVAHMMREQTPRHESSILVVAMRVRSSKHDHRFNVDVEGQQNVFEPFAVDRVGFSLARFSRGAIERMALHAGQPWDEPSPDGDATIHTAPGLFIEYIEKRTWHPEDFAFCARAKASGVPIFAVILPGITHAGIANFTETEIT